MTHVELTLTESFQRHKRNLMIICSAITVLWLSSPPKLKLPFIGADSVFIKANIAFSLLAVALAYMFIQYYIEYSTIRVRNSQTIAGGDAPTVDEVISSHLGEITQWFSIDDYNINIKQAVEQLQNGLAERALETNLSRIMTHIRSDSTNLNRQAAHRNDLSDDSSALGQSDGQQYNNQIKVDIHEAVRQSIVIRDEYIEALTKSHNEVLSRQAEVLKKLEANYIICQNLAKGLNKISTGISRSQRAGFRVIDGYLTFLFAVAALAFCIAGSKGFFLDDITYRAGRYT